MATCDEIVQTRGNTKAAKRLLIRLMKKQRCLPKRIVTDKLRPYRTARRQTMPMIEHRSHKRLNNCAEKRPWPGQLPESRLMSKAHLRG